MTPLIVFERAVLGYGGPVLTNVGFQVNKGDYVGIVGPNGAGKTTLLKAILGVLKPISGTVTVGCERRRIGYVPQRDTLDTLFPLTALDVALMGLYDEIGPVRRPNARHRARAFDALDSIGIADLARRSYASLSGGQKQRVIIARSLVANPETLILDEPTNGMDLPAEQGILSLIDHLHRSHAITVLLVSHLLHVVLNHATRFAIVSDGTVTALDRGEMLGGEHLGAVYGMPVDVREVGGMVFAVPAVLNRESQQ